MRRLSKRVVLLSLASLLLLSLAVRYPLVEHERHQSDSYSIHLLAQSILDEGYAKWTFHPLSYFGYYPVSYPSGAPFLLSELSSISGLSVEASTLAVSCIIGLVFVLGVFCLAQLFLKRTEFALLASFFASMGPRFVDTSYWVGSARCLVVLFIVLAVFILLRAEDCGQRRLWLFSVLFVIGALATHHMAVLLLAFAVAFLVAQIMSMIISRYSRSRQPRVSILLHFGIAVCGVFVTVVFLDYFVDSIVRAFSGTYVFDFDPDIVSTLLNMAVSYTHQIGLILIVAAIALPSLMMKTFGHKREFLLVSLCIVLLPVVANSLYLSLVLLPFVSIMAAKWFADRFSRKETCSKSCAIALAVLICFTIALPIWSTNTWNSDEYVTGDTRKVDAVVFNDSTYLRMQFEDPYSFSNSDSLSLQIAAISGTKFLRSGVPMAVNGDITEQDVKDDLVWRGTSFPINLYLWFEYEKESYPLYTLVGIMTDGLSFLVGSGTFSVYARDLASIHKNAIIVIDTNWENNYAGRWGVVPSEFMLEVRDARWLGGSVDDGEGASLSSYVTYISERTSMYLFEYPGFE